MDRFWRLLDLTMDHVVEPGMYWVIHHPIISLLVVLVLVIWSMRGYRIL